MEQTMTGPSHRPTTRRAGVLAALCLATLVASCAGGDRTMSSPSGTDAPDRQSNGSGSGGSSGGGHGGY
jgi:hypothetical protein